MAFELRATRYETARNAPLAKFIVEDLRYLDYDDTLDFYERVVPKTDHMGRALLGANDRYFLLTGLLRRKDMLHPWLFNRCREVEADPDGHIDLWPRYHGKAIDVDEPVPTPSGWRRHGDLKRGDEVYGHDGLPTRVVARTRVSFDEDCYRVTFCDGYSVVVSGNHLWTVNIHSMVRISGNKREKWRSETLSTRELMAEVARSTSTPTRRYPTISVSAPVSGVTADLPLDPYVLGAWLGDGSKSNPRITSGLTDADEMQSILSACGVLVRRAVHSNAVSLTLGTGVRGKRGSSDVVRALKDLDVYENKHIPDIYLSASLEQRWALLQGLMDTDGTCHKEHSQCLFCSVSHRLASDTFALAASLGMKPTLGERTVLYRGARRPFWQVLFRGYADRAPFRLKRKIALCKPVSWHQPSRKVISVSPVPSRPVSCIQVSNKDGLYLIGKNYVATHNSSVVTFAGIIQDIICDPEITTAIFSVTKPLAQAFLAQIKDEFEGNDYLKQLYSDVLYQDPKKRSPTEGKPTKWGIARGFTVKRRGNQKEATLEAHGLIDGQPTSRHFDKHVYDDIVTQDYIGKDQIRKTTQRWEMADNLGTLDGVRKQIVGTLYHHADTHVQIIDRGSAKPRIYKATVDGTLNGDPILLSVKRWEEIKRDQRSTVSAQMLLDPSAGTDATFRAIWLKTYDVSPEVLNVYIMCDPSKGSTNRSDRTAIAVIGIDPAGNKYLLDGVRHRMKLSDRYAFLIQFKEKWEKRRGVQMVKVGYERYGQLTDLEVIEEYQRRDNKMFPIEELNTPRQGRHSKDDRIGRLEPDMRRGAFYLPGVVYHPDHGDKNGYSVWKPWTKDDQAIALKAQKAGHSIGHILYEPMRGLSRAQKVREFYGDNIRIVKPIRRRDEDNNVYDLTRAFIEEMVQHPFAPYDDLIDAVSRIYDMEPTAPIAYESGATDPIGGEDDLTPGMYGDGDVGDDSHLDS